MASISLRKVIQQAFPDISTPEAEELIAVGSVHSYPPAKVLTREGNVENVFYLLIEGQVKVVKTINEEENRFMKPLGPGEFFGEHALIHEEPRTATVITLTPVTALEITKDEFDKMLRKSSSVSVAIARAVSRRLQENDQLAIDDLRMKAKELALAYQKLAEKDFARREFLTTIAHELRTPLTAANGYLQFMQSGALKGDALNAAIRTTAQNVQRVITLVNDILFLQEMDLILDEAGPVQVGTVVTSAIEQKRASAEETGLGLDVRIAPNLPLVIGSQESLERAFSALIENAIKFSPDGGDVVITVESGEEGITAKIQDQGVGIPEDALPRIFDRYYRMETVQGHLFGGAGLGLSIAHQVIEQHNGHITVESVLGEGSTFSVFLPYTQPDPPTTPDEIE
jgi:signal transduction histidine kinase